MEKQVISPRRNWEWNRCWQETSREISEKVLWRYDIHKKYPRKDTKLSRKKWYEKIRGDKFISTKRHEIFTKERYVKICMIRGEYNFHEKTLNFHERNVRGVNRYADYGKIFFSSNNIWEWNPLFVKTMSNLIKQQEIDNLYFFIEKILYFC